MTNDEAKKMLEAKLECLKRETSGTNYDCNMRLCDGCSLNYEQGNMGEQKEAFDLAIKALEQQQDKVIYNHPCEDCYYNDGDVHAECVVCDKPLEQQPCEYEPFTIAEVSPEMRKLMEEWQQPCEDCVSREALINELKLGYFNKDLQEGKNDPCVIDAMIDWAIRTAKRLPSVTPKYTDEEIQKMQELEQAQLEKAYELGKTESFEDWLNSFNTDSATECFTAVQQLKEKTKEG